MAVHLLVDPTWPSELVPSMSHDAEYQAWGLGGCYLMGQCNNQPNDGFRGGGGIGEETRVGGMCGGGRLLVVLGG